MPKLQVSKIIPIFAVDNSLFAMPEIFRFYGFSFFFYSREHEPLHVHVEGKGGMARFDWGGGVFVLSEMHGIKANDLKKIKDVIDDNADIIVRRWEEYFGGR